MEHPFKLTLAAVVLLVGSAVPSAGQQFEYSPYRGFNNTGGQPTDPPPDNYTPTHPGVPGSGAVSGGAAASTSQSGDAYSGGNSAAAGAASPPARGGYSTPRGTYSPSEDVFSPAQNGRGAAPPSQPPRGVGGPQRQW